MKKVVSNIFSVSHFIWLILAVILYMLPMLANPVFHYIDDGENLIAAKTVLASANPAEWKETLFEYEAGRMRPAYQLYFVLIYLMFEAQPFAYWFFQTVVIALTAIGMWKLFRAVSKVSKWVITLSVIVFLLLPAVIENAYRLGTAEPRQAMFIVWFLVWLSNLKLRQIRSKDFLIGNGLLLLALTTKETSLILVPLVVIYFGMQWLKARLKTKRSWILFLSLLVQAVVFLLLLPKRQAYTANVDFSLAKLWYGVLVTRFDYAEYYFPLAVALTLFFYRSLKSLYRRGVLVFLKTLQWPLIFLTGVASSLFFVFSWEHQLERYHYLTFIFMIGFILYEASFYTFSLPGPKKNLRSSFGYTVLTAITLVIVTIVMFQNRYLYQKNVVTRTIDSFQQMFFRHQAAGALTTFLFHSLPSNTAVFIDSEEYETVVGVGEFASRLGERNVLVYSNNEHAPENYADIQKYSSDVFADYKEAAAPKLLVVADYHRIYFALDELELLSPKFVNIYSDHVYLFWRIMRSF